MHGATRVGPRRRLAAGAAAVLAVAATACGAGGAGPAAGPTSSVAADQTVEISTVEIRMVDHAFRPEEVRVKAGTTVRFVFTNDGRVVHDATFGDEAHQQAVASGRARRDGVILNPRQTGDYVRTFTAPGTFLIGCHQAGHYRAGMKARLIVE
jgi:uncharacterized cupredoxin-like copper-binding protein